MTKLKLNSKKQTVTATEDLLVNLQHGKSSSLEVNVPKSGNIKIISIVHGKGKESYKLNYKIRHDYPNTYSNSVFKVVLEILWVCSRIQILVKNGFSLYYSEVI